MTVLAALASIPRRSHILPSVLASLRPQVDRLCVYLNGYAAAPSCVSDLADEFVLAPENEGAERKLHWADRCDGVYLSCDDDFVYTPDYAATMVEAVERWHGKAIVTAHGRVYTGKPGHVHDLSSKSIGTVFTRVKEGRWVNHGGTGVMAWDARTVHVPTEWAHMNMADLQLAVWAQHARVPMWLIPHKSSWLGSLAESDPNGLWRTSKREGHRRRSALLVQHGNEKPWETFAHEATT